MSIENITKKQTIEHYERMIKWAKTQPEKDLSLMMTMKEHINENWSGNYCSYCKIYSTPFSCPSCPLGSGPDLCCFGAWGAMNSSGSWGKWVINANIVLEYIKENG